MPKLTAVHYLFKEKREGRWLAHCLDFDIVTAGITADEAEGRLDRLVRRYIEDALRLQNPTLLMTAAPREFWKRYHEAFAAGRMRPSREPLQIRFPAPQVPVLTDDDLPESSGQVEVLSVAAAA
jgi:predicted RNase H-like HicB family nuclease